MRIVIPLLACITLSAGCSAMRASRSQIDSIALLPPDDDESGYFNIDFATATNRLKNEMSRHFGIVKEQVISDGKILVFASYFDDGSFELARALMVQGEEGIEIKVKCEPFGDENSQATMKVGKHADERAIIEAIGTPERDAKERVLEAKIKQDKQRAIDAWDSLPPAERIAGRDWQDTYDRYIRLGYKYDEAQLMADRIVGGRPTHLPPRE